MNFTVYIPERRRVDDRLLVGLAERVNARLGAPLQAAVDAEELLAQAEAEGLIEPLPRGAVLIGEHCFRYGRDRLRRLAKRARSRG